MESIAAIYETMPTTTGPIHTTEKTDMPDKMLDKIPLVSNGSIELNRSANPKPSLSFHITPVDKKKRWMQKYLQEKSGVLLALKRQNLFDLKRERNKSSR